MIFIRVRWSKAADIIVYFTFSQPGRWPEVKAPEKSKQIEFLQDIVLIVI